MDKVQKYNSFNTNTPSSESYKNYESYYYVKVKVKVKLKLSLFFNRAPRNEGVLGSGGITPRIL
jgi:hypothetical protein